MPAVGPGYVFTKAGRGDRARTCSSNCASRPTAWAAQGGARWSPPGPAALASGWRTCCARTASRQMRQADTWRGAHRPAGIGATAVVTLGLERGFVAGQVSVVSEQDLLGERISRPPRRRKRADQFIAEATEIAEGDLVVHQEYGIGRYDGLETLRVGPAPHDCLRLIYDGSEKLYLPVENIELLSRFGSEGGGVALDKLGGAGWQTRKARMKQRIRDMAGELIRTAAARRRAGGREPRARRRELGRVSAPASPSPRPRTSRAPSADVLEDMAAGRPMDRLICGDVGFGKTEVALRAAFVAAMSGAQVAVVVPTTLLARQHHRTFNARFAGLPVKIGQLVPHGDAQGRGGNQARPGGRQHQHRGRHPRAAGQGHRVRRPGTADRGRGAAFRRVPQGEAEAAQGRRPCADADRDAHPAHPATGADRCAGDEH